MKLDHASLHTRPLSIPTLGRPAATPRSLLPAIDSPADLKALPAHRLEAICAEIRRFLLTSVADTGGHFASSMGVVELSVALHRVFDSRVDRLVWDVGHQAYVHKILTGRRGCLHSIRKSGGISGFPSRAESVHDAFGTAHSSTSVSAVLGMAVAAKLAGDTKRRHVAVIGDGALTAGLAFEALCNAADSQANVLIVVNDNQMSISENVGAIPRHLQSRLDGGPVGRTANLFEVLGLACDGPVDGHDVHLLERRLRALSDRGGVQVLHIRTCKGKGYTHAERDPIAYHGPAPFDPGVGLRKSGSTAPTFSQVFGRWACDAAQRDPRLAVITPAMREGSGLVEYARQWPERYFDVGIAEQHALTFAAGLACDRFRPVVAIYSTFLQRAYDQLIHDIALQNLPVMLAIDRAGLVGADGPTHAGAFDIAYLRPVPNIVIMTPADESECVRMLNTGLRLDGPSAVRYPRGGGPGVLPQGTLTETLPVGKAQLCREGSDVALLAFGTMLAPAMQAGARLDATVVNMRFVKPIDEDMIAGLAATHRLIVTIEEGCLMGGAGSAVSECLDGPCVASRVDVLPAVLRLGLPDCFLPHGDCARLLSGAGLDADGIVAAVERRLDCRGATAPRRMPVRAC